MFYLLSLQTKKCDIIIPSRVMGFSLPIYSGCSARPSPRQGLAKTERPLYIKGDEMKKGDSLDRFWAKVNKTSVDGCWIWTGATCGPDRNYGNFRYLGKNIKAHRLSYEIAFGPFSSELLVCHKCDNGLCVNPSHLFIGTQKDNIDDMHKKGRAVHVGLKGENHPRHKLTNADALEIRSLYAAGKSQYALADMFGVSRSTIANVVRDDTWSNHPRRKHCFKCSPYGGRKGG